MIEFYINRGSVNPVLRMELILDGRYDYKKSFIDDALQDSNVTFTMKNHANDDFVLIKEPALIKLEDNDSCEERYVLEYDWKKRDVSKPGVYDCQFEITFNGNIIQNGVDYPTGNLKVPILENLVVYIR